MSEFENNPAMGQHYSSLLSTVSELRSELERTVSKIGSMEEQNRSLQMNNKQLTELLKETRKKYNEAQENYMNTVGAKFEQERQHESFLEQVKIQLAEKSKEFEEHREKFAPQDVDIIRIKVQEEMEIPHKQRILAMEQEVEKQKESAFQTQRELERCKADFETHSQLQAQAAAVALEEHEASMNELQSYVSRLKDRNFNAEKDDKIRSQRVQLGEVEQTVISLRNEISAVRSERDESVYTLEQTRTRYSEEMTALRATMATNDSAKTSAEKKSSLLASELDARDSQLRISKTTISDLQRTIENLKSDVQTAVNEVQRGRDESAAALDAQRTLFDSERGRQAAVIENLMGKLHSREEQLRRIQRENVEVQVRAESIEATTRRIYSGQLAEAKQKIDALHLEAADLRDRLGNEISTLQRTLDLSKSEVSVYKTENDRLRREKGVLHDKVQNMETKFVTERSQSSLLKRDISSKLAVAEERENRLRSELRKVNTAYEEAKSHDEDQQKELRRLQSRISKLELESDSRVSLTTASMKEQQENIERICLMKLEEGKREALDQIAKEKKKTEAYREKALESHARNKALLTRYQSEPVSFR